MSFPKLNINHSVLNVIMDSSFHCLIPGCSSKKTFAKRLCEKHWRRLRKRKRCNLCTHIEYRRGLCQKHYHSCKVQCTFEGCFDYQRNGTLCDKHATLLSTPAFGCRIQECKNKKLYSVKHALCKRHYKEFIEKKCVA